MSSNDRYIDFPVDIDSQDRIQKAFDYLKTKNPSWEPSEGHIDTWILEAGSSESADIARLVQYVPKNIFRYYGQVLFGIPQIAATSATGTINIFATDSVGHTFSAGMQVGIRNSLGDLVAFTLVNDATIIAGQTHVDNVLVVAAVAGVASSGLGSIGGVVELIDNNQYVDHIIQATVTSGGVDGETDAAYNTRLSLRLQLMSPRPITERDYGILARDVAGVQRAVAVDGYNPEYNILTANQSSAETDATGWAVGVNTTLASTAAQAADGAKSISLTSVAAGNMSAATPSVVPPAAGSYKVIPGNTVTGLVSIRSAVSVRSCQAQLSWYDATGTLLSSTLGAAANDSTTAWTQYSVVGTAPTNAAYVRLFAVVNATGGAAEVHYIDKALLGKGNNPTWAIGPATATAQEKMVTVYAVDSTGTIVSAGIKTSIATYLEGLRELNFMVFAADPTVNQVDVTTQFTVFSDYDLTDTQSRVVAAIQQYLSPALWGISNNDDPNDPITWTNTKNIYYLELAAVINGIPGVNRVTTLTIGAHSGSLLAADYALSGNVPLPQAVTINATGQYG